MAHIRPQLANVGRRLRSEIPASHTDMRDWKTELTGRVLVLVAHADDECVGYGALLQKMRAPVLVIATDGAPRDEYFWGRFGSREAYAAVRREEARRAAQVVGLYPSSPTTGALGTPVRELVLLAEQDARLEDPRGSRLWGSRLWGSHLEDQRLFLNLPVAYALLEELAERVRPDAIATLAYEGGHPDHDSCSVLAARLGARLGVPVWEAPLYARFQGFKVSRFQSLKDESTGKGAAGWDTSPPALAVQGQRAEGGALEGELRFQQFLFENGTEAQVEISPEELERKRAMCAEYASQGEILRVFDARREVVRPQVRYDYAQRPHAGPVNYECWQWWMRADEVSAKFAEFVESGQ